MLLLLALAIASGPIDVQAHTPAARAASSHPSSAALKAQASARTAPVSTQAPETITPSMTITQTLSDEAQRNTIAFDGLAFMTGSLGADSFFPPGKVADFWGFQYLRDNDPSQMGHNPLFLTSAAFNMWSILTTAQRQQLLVLANSQVSSIDEYAYRRFVLMKAFRRQLDGDIPAGSPGLGESAVKAYSAELYKLDGQMSYDRARVMGDILHSLTLTQTTFLNTNMVGKGMLEWPAVSDPVDMNGLAREVKQALMTYSGDLYSWYAGSLAADVYFCPERQGTYFGSFYLKDTPVMTTGGSIDPNLTANAGITFTLTLNPAQQAQLNAIVATQKPALYEIVDRRQDISTQLRRFIAGQTVDSSIVLSQTERYGELDGEIIYKYATTFSNIYQTLNSAQKASLAALRQKLLGDFDLIPDPYAYLYADRIAMPTIPDTDFLFLPGTDLNSVFLPMIAKNSVNFSLGSPTVQENGALPAEYTCDGSSSTLALNWIAAPVGTESYAVVMHHAAAPGDIHVYWVLYNIPASVTSLNKNSSGVGTLGLNSVNDTQAYAPPCSQGPGLRVYTYTVYALSAQPSFSVPASQVTRDVLLSAIQDITLASAELHVTYTRSP